MPRVFWYATKCRYLSFPKEIRAGGLAIAVRSGYTRTPLGGSQVIYCELVAESVLQVDWVVEVDGEHRFKERAIGTCKQSPLSWALCLLWVEVATLGYIRLARRKLVALEQLVYRLGAK